MEETHTQGTHCHKGRTQQITEGDDKNTPRDYGYYQFDTETDDKHMDKIEGAKWDYRRGLTNLSSTKADRELMAKKNRKLVSTQRVKITP